MTDNVSSERSIFESAIEKRSPEERAALLAAACGDDRRLREGVEALLAAHDPVKAKLVELRFFAGLTLGQAAECLDVSPSTADRAWRYARAWLYAAMASDKSEKK